MDAFSLCSLCLGHWVKIALLSTRSNKEHMTCVLCYLSVCTGGFPLDAYHPLILLEKAVMSQSLFEGWEEKDKKRVNAVFHTQLVPSCTSKAECSPGPAELRLMCSFILDEFITRWMWTKSNQKGLRWVSISSTEENIRLLYVFFFVSE